MSRHTLTPMAARDLVGQLLATERPVDINLRYVDSVIYLPEAGTREVHRYDPDVVRDHCKKFQPKAMRRAFAIAARLDEMEAEHLKYLEKIAEHGWKGDLEKATVGAIRATIGALLAAGEAS